MYKPAQRQRQRTWQMTHYVQTGKILWDYGQTSLGNTWAGFIGRYRLFLFSFFLLLYLGVFTIIAVIDRALNHHHHLRV